MRRHVAAFTLALLGASRWSAAAVDVRVSGQAVDVVATNAPLSEVLDRLSRQTHMRLVYDGAPPRQPISLDLKGRTSLEAVLAALEGQGVNYAMGMDSTGTRVETLLVSGLAPSTARAGNTGNTDMASRLASARENQREPMAMPEPVLEEPPPIVEDDGQIAADTTAALLLANPQLQKKEGAAPAQQPEQGPSWARSPFAPDARPADPAPATAPPPATLPSFNP
jgi:hypothetical protein